MTHHVTTIELLFDLVFVYAITNVTALIEHDLSGEAVLEGVITLAVVWFGWCAYTWLGNQAKADEGLLRLAMVVAMAGMFFVAISIPYAFEGEGNAAVVLVVAYGVVRLTHVGVYIVAAGDDAQLRSVLVAMLGIALVVLSLLITGAVVGGSAQKWWWCAAVAVDQLGVYLVRSTRWRLPSASHFAERFGLIVIIAIGESIVAVGRRPSVGRADRPRRHRAAVRVGHRGVPLVALLRRRSHGWRGGAASVVGCRADALRPRLVHVRPLPDGRRHSFGGFVAQELALRHPDCGRPHSSS